MWFSLEGDLKMQSGQGLEHQRAVQIKGKKGAEKHSSARPACVLSRFSHVGLWEPCGFCA